ncbi:autophagy-related protein 13-like [Bubalus kerabau]|uniref:autophagy-related protein 13-like n=1 Tax=Bubalus carabanensis TaxID=3119969 RepID=UPI00244E7DCB|nr:autophagy-related protein 13-like [Bubalus carabanensis]
MGHPGSVAVPDTPLLDGTATLSSSEDAETVSKSSEGRACPHDVLEIIFVRKVGAFVNKPINQATLTSLDIPFAMFAPKNLELEDADPMGNPPDSPETTSPLQGGLHSDGSSGGSSGHTQDDFVMIDFKPAFSKDDILPMDLGTFYREFQNQPQLSSLSLDIGAQSVAEDLIWKPLGRHLTLWPPALLLWPFLLRRPGEFFPLLPHAHSSHLAVSHRTRWLNRYLPAIALEICIALRGHYLDFACVYFLLFSAFSSQQFSHSPVVCLMSSTC